MFWRIGAASVSRSNEYVILSPTAKAGPPLPAAMAGWLRSQLVLTISAVICAEIVTALLKVGQIRDAPSTIDFKIFTKTPTCFFVDTDDYSWDKLGGGCVNCSLMQP